ncbi:MAG: hypothetical protein ACHQWU_02225 [Gemmatimonadales bacterium]
MTAETQAPAPTDADDRAHIRRIVKTAIGVLVIEVALFLVALRAPALRGLIRPVYVIVLVLGVLGGWHAAWRRSRGDRRHENRRHRP